MSQLAEPMTATSANTGRPQTATRTFLPYLEGMRGFFGLYIGIMHALYRVMALRPGSVFVPPHYIAFGHNAIAMFIVVSGFVLGLPVARDGQTFRSGVLTYAKRRALRILPAYYAALLIAIPVAWFFTRLYEQPMTLHQMIASIALHAVMLHNLSDGTIGTIDGPMWSVAVEFDCYLLFPLVLVPLARRFGFIVMTIAAFAIGFSPLAISALRHHDLLTYRFASTSPWYLGLFALGYAAANITVDHRKAMIERLGRWPWGLFAKIFFVAMLVSLALTPTDPALDNNAGRWVADVLIGLALAAQFVSDAQARNRGQTTRFERFFTWGPIVFAGTFSYSYYLIHLPVIDVVMSLARPGWNVTEVYALAAAAFALSLAVAYALYFFIERPSMTAYRRRGDAQSLHSRAVREIPDAAVSP